MKEKIITFCGSRAKINCDGNCEKAWGFSNRPEKILSSGDSKFLSDDELGIAPKNPGTTEGESQKPSSPNKFPNKWCVRECERSNISKPGESYLPLELLRF